MILYPKCNNHYFKYDQEVAEYREIGAFEAKTNLVSCSIREVARLLPAKLGFNRHAAVRRIRERAEHLNLGPFDWSEWKAFRDAGRP